MAKSINLADKARMKTEEVNENLVSSTGSKLSAYERETIINLNESDDMASIYTYKRKFKKHILKLIQDYPELCTLDKQYKDLTTEELEAITEDSQKALSATIPWKWVKLGGPRAKRDLTDEQRKELAERMKKARAVRSGNVLDMDDDMDDDDDE